MATYGLDDETRALRARVREFIDGEVIPAEPDLMTEGPAAAAAMARLKQAAKDAGLWALGHPKEIGGGGVPFMPFVYLNEIIGRSHWGQAAVGSLSMQDSIMLHLYGSAEQKRRWLEPLSPARSTRRWASPNRRWRAPTRRSCSRRRGSTVTSGS
jgi:alkylation response protein AidB-like acyl-CoA dehydrogenase